VHSTLALEHGASAHVVASSLGHESFSATVESHAKPEANQTDARQRRAFWAPGGVIREIEFVNKKPVAAAVVR
jgi:hypothetical protein